MTHQPGESGAVLLVANYRSDVGYAWWLMEHYWATLAAALSSIGRKVFLAYPEILGVPDVVKRSPLELVELPVDFSTALSRSRVFDFVRRHQVTGVYLTDRDYWSRWYLPLKRAGVRSIVVHDHAPGERPRGGSLRRLAHHIIHRWTAFPADWFLAPTAFVRDRMIRSSGLPSARVITVPNGVPPFEYCPEDRPWARQQLGVGADDVVVGLVSRAHRVKGIDFAIQCAEAAPRLGLAALTFCFIGDGPDLERLRQHAEHLDLGTRFRFLGQRPDARRLMAGFDIGLHPSEAEVGFCLAILEMMAAGLPVVVPNRPSVNGATTDRSTGMVYDANSVSDAMRALRALTQDPEARREMGSHARADVAARFSIDASIRAMRDLVAPLL